MVSKKIARFEESVVELRKNGKTCSQVAEELEVPVWAIWQVMRNAGLDGQIRNYSHRRKPAKKPRPLIDRVLGSVDSVLIERGAGGGIIATIGESWTGTEQDTADAAVRSAIEMMESNDFEFDKE